MNPSRGLVAPYLATSALAATGTVTAITISAIAAERMLGAATWSGLPMAASTLGTAIGSQMIGRNLERFPLRGVLVSHYVLALLGGGLAAHSVAQGHFALLVLGLAALGMGNSATLYVRYLAGDLFPPARRAQALSWMVWMTGVGAVIGPTLLGRSGRWAGALGLPEEAGPYLTATVIFALCATAYTAVLPKDLHADPGGEDRTTANASAVSLATPHWPRVTKLALLAMVVGHVVMVLVMTMTPIHLIHHGQDLSTVGVVLSAHMAGMFLCAPLAGWLCGKLGAGPVLIGGSVLLTAACLLAGLSAGTWSDQIPMIVPLFLLGLGWSFGFISGSALLTNNLPPSRRIRGRAFADASIWTAAATSSLASSLLFSNIGFARLSWVACAMAICLSALLVGQRKALQHDGAS